MRDIRNFLFWTSFGFSGAAWYALPCSFWSLQGQTITGALGVGQSVVAGPEGEIIHEALTGEEVILFEANLDKVRRTRKRGILGLGQPLKSYRDSIIGKSTKLQPNNSLYLESLGPLEVPIKEA